MSRRHRDAQPTAQCHLRRREHAPGHSLGFDPIGAELRFLPFALLALIAAVAAAPLLNFLPGRFLVAASASFAAAGLLMLVHLASRRPRPCSSLG